VDTKKAARLRQARKLANFDTAAEAARSMGLAYATYAAHENATRGFSDPEADRYARHFKIDVQWLLYGVGNPRGPDIMWKIRSLSPTGRSAAEDHIDYLLDKEAKAKRREGKNG
jgi:hypothetical protein